MAWIDDMLESTTYHKPSETSLVAMDRLRHRFHALLVSIDCALPQPSRHKSLAGTAIEEALGWVMKGLSAPKKDGEVS